LKERDEHGLPKLIQALKTAAGVKAAGQLHTDPCFPSSTPFAQGSRNRERLLSSRGNRLFADCLLGRGGLVCLNLPGQQPPPSRHRPPSIPARARTPSHLTSKKYSSESKGAAGAAAST
jgi:hypothetical protein